MAYDKSIESFARRMQILGMFKGDQKLTANMIYGGLSGTGDDVTMRSVQRGLEMLTDGGYLELVNPGSKPLQWRWPKGKKSITLPRLLNQEILAIRLLEQFLMPMLPPDFYNALVPYFDAAEKELNNMSV